MKITTNSLLLYWQFVCDSKSKDKHYVSSPSPLFTLSIFDDLVFNPDNAFSNDILRYKIDCYDRDNVYNIADACILSPWVDNAHMVYIWNIKTHIMYTVGWYKERGRTETMQINGGDMTLDDYLEALHTIGLYEWEDIPEGPAYHDEAIAYLRQLSETSSI